MRKIMKKCLLLLAVAALLLSLAGCGTAIDDSSLRAKTDQMLDAILAGDGESAYALVADIVTETEFAQTFDTMRQSIPGVRTYELKLTNFNFNTTNGKTTKQVSYLMETDAGSFVIDVAEHSDYDGLIRFYITPEAYTNLSYTGVPGHMEGANAVQWGLLILSLLVIGFSVWVLADCCRRKIKHKVLWIIAIVLGAVSLSATRESGSFNLGIHITLFLNYSALILYGSGAVSFRLLIPVGVIVYFAMRDKLTVKEQELPAEVPVGEELGEMPVEEQPTAISEKTE